MNKLPTSNVQLPNKSEILNSNQTEIPKYNLRERLFIFGKRALQICREIPNKPEYEGIKKQLANSGTSIGANFEEADGSITKKDFVSKVSIARKEAQETKYWLKIVLCETEMNLNKDIQEAQEIINILSVILIKSGFQKRKN